MKPCHFYLAFNPLFNGAQQVQKSQAHEFYDLLKQRQGTEKKFLYWGKLQVTQYSDQLKIKNFEDVVLQNAIENLDTHLFITDYHYLWVAKVDEVTQERPSESDTLPFYKDKNVEIWFKISDFDLLSNDATLTAKFLTEMYVDNEFYPHKIKEMNPFSSGIRFPMIMQDRLERPFFKDLPFHRVAGENPLLDNKGQGMDIKNISQTFVIPEENFKKLPESIRSQIMYAEILLLESTTGARRDRAKLEEAIHTYLKCLEMLLNMTFINHLKREEGHRLYVTQEAPYRLLRSPLDKDKKNLQRLKDFKGTIELSQMKMILDSPNFFQNTSLDFIFKNRKKFWEYLRIELRHTIRNESLIEMKNLLGQGQVVKAHDRELILVRNILLGVGGKGVFNDVIENYYADEIRVERSA
jgi:hypothetical protein